MTGTPVPGTPVGLTNVAVPLVARPYGPVMAILAFAEVIALLIYEGVDPNVGLLHQILDVFRPRREFSQIAIQRRAMAEYLIQEPFVSFVGHRGGV